jgi:hypothetical protein
MEVEQMMACLLAEIRTGREEMTARLEAMIQNQEKLDANLKEIRLAKNTERGNAGQDGNQQRKDCGQDGRPATENRGLSVKDRGHGFGGKSRRNRARGGA